MASLEEQINQAVNDPDLPNFYINGFTVSAGSADMVFILKLQDRPVAVLRTTYEVAKTLIVKTEPIIQKIEKATDQTFKTTDEVEELLKKKFEISAEKDNSNE